MLVGLGTGSTVYYFIKALIKRCKEGLRIQAVSSSDQSTRVAQEGGIELLNPSQFTKLDLTVDGADEIDANFQMIKGGGGALLREKIMAYHSKRLVIIVDETKCCSMIGAKKLPIEVIPYGLMATKRTLEHLGLCPELRKQQAKDVYMTDNQNYIFDLKIPALIQKPKELEKTLCAIPGVVETGLFLNMTHHLIIGFSDGTIEERFRV